MAGTRWRVLVTTKFIWGKIEDRSFQVGIRLLVALGRPQEEHEWKRARQS